MVSLQGSIAASRLLEKQRAPGEASKTGRLLLESVYAIAVVRPNVFREITNNMVQIPELEQKRKTMLHMAHGREWRGGYHL